MKIVVTIEDTPRGISFDHKVMFSGVNDGTERSLAVHVLASFETALAKLQRLGVLRVEGANLPAAGR